MLNKFNLKTLTRRGDTIVEVMVVLAVLGLAIGISYATANRSLLDTRQSQENSEAAELVQTQLEELRLMTKDTVYNIFQSGPYCINPDPSVAVPNPPYKIDTGSNCSYGSYPTTVAICYDDTACNASATTSTFTVTATWPDVAGQGYDTATLTYRLYKL